MAEEDPIKEKDSPIKWEDGAPTDSPNLPSDLPDPLDLPPDSDLPLDQSNLPPDQSNGSPDLLNLSPNPMNLPSDPMNLPPNPINLPSDPSNLPQDLSNLNKDILESELSPEKGRDLLKKTRLEETLGEKLSKSRSGQNPAFDFFLYLVSFLTLGFMASGIGSVLFQLINKFVDQSSVLYSAYFSQGVVKYGIASLIIATPIYFIFVYLINKHLYQGKIDRDSKVRKWLTYIILFVAAAVIIGDLISLIYNLLEGEIVLRIILKVMVILLIAAAIFSFYFWDIRKKETAQTKYGINKIVAVVLAVVALIVLVSAFFVIDSPRQTRDKKIDQETIDTLSQVEQALRGYYVTQQELPANLENFPSNYYLPKFKPEANITYARIGDKTFKLCAYFRSSTSDLSDNEKTRSYPYYGGQGWDHSGGQVCFERQIMTSSKGLEILPLPLQELPID